MFSHTMDPQQARDIPTPFDDFVVESYSAETNGYEHCDAVRSSSNLADARSEYFGDSACQSILDGVSNNGYDELETKSDGEVRDNEVCDSDAQ